VKTRVLDSWPILEWINGRPPATEYLDKLFAEAERGRTALLISAMNVGEVYYFLRKNHDATLAEVWRETSRTLPVTIEVPALSDIWDAAILKSKFPIAYADAFAAALARKYECPLVTGDPELRTVHQLEIDWISRTRKPGAV
jgi:predicted nucleic acid-binding protein